jgi:hypothetical protein
VIELARVTLQARSGRAALCLVIGVDLFGQDEPTGVGLPTPPDRQSVFDPSPDRG